MTTLSETSAQMKPIPVPTELHTKLKLRARAEGKKLYALTEQLIRRGLEAEKILATR